MKHRSRRIIKKLHRHWLPDCAIDVSQASTWRARLFESEAGEVFELSRTEVSGLSRRTALAVQKFGLRFSVAVGDAQEAEPWLSDNGCVVFKFWATDFPTVNFLSGNDPAIR